MVGFILLVIGIIIAFMLNFTIGMVMIALALILNMLNDKNIFVWIVIILSVIALVVVPALHIYWNRVENVQKMSMSVYEDTLVTKAKEYAQNKRYYDEIELAPNTILTKLELGIVRAGCEEYVVYNSKDDVKAYLKCEDYTTKGFDKTKLK